MLYWQVAHRKDKREDQMQVKGLTWLGLRTDQFEEMVKFFRDVWACSPFETNQRLRGFS
jgi:hypothetical protein